MQTKYTKAMHLADLRGVKKALMAQQRELELRLVHVQREIDKVLPPLKLEPFAFGFKAEIAGNTYFVSKCVGGWKIEGPKISEIVAHLSTAKGRLQQIQESLL